MKKKFIPIVALTSLITLGVLSTTLVSCNNDVVETIEVSSITLTLSKNEVKVGETVTATVTINPTDASDKTYTLSASKEGVVTISGNTLTAIGAGEVVITATSTSGAKTATATLKVTENVVNVTDITLTLDKTTVLVGETINASVKVLPDNATNKNYTITSSDTAKLSVNGNVLTALKDGKVNVTVTSEDGNLTDTVEVTINPVDVNPTLTLTGETSLTVAAGVDLTLPVATAKDYDGTDITSEIIVEDYDDTSSISEDYKTFNSKIAGVHTVSYYVENASGNYDEAEVTVTVTPTNEETFDVSGYQDLEALKEYGTFKENFENGIQSPLYKGLTDSNRSSYLSATDEGISGNSLIVDFNKTAGNASYSLFMSGFKDYFIRGVPVTYEVSFDYKVLSNASNTGDCYVGLSWDDSTGLNKQFVSVADGSVGHYTTKFTEVSVPDDDRNAYFFFFKLGATSEPVKIAIDNIEVTAIEAAQSTIVVPTSEELMADGGFTFNWKERSSTFNQGETIIVNNIEDETIKNAILAHDTSFGEQVMKLTGRDDHTFAGLNATNMISGMELVIDFDYYSVDDSGLLVLPMASGTQNGTLSEGSGLTTSIVDGNVKHLNITYKISSGVNALNFYPQNANFEIYMGNMTVKLQESSVVVPDDETELGHKVGDSWTQTSRSFGSENKGFCEVTNDFTTPETVTGEGIGSTITRLKYSDSAANCTVEWYQPGLQQLEAGHKYSIEVVYFIESIPSGSRFMLNFDNNVFLELENGIGYHKVTLDWTATISVNFFSFYAPESFANAVVYVASTTVTLTEIIK
ncbi:MAG: Ig-like domain-containing protein [Candidatus Onthovivens sp.]|nr:Ig-like domain-containing protein [Candidatus Onthovivens sp.]